MGRPLTGGPRRLSFGGCRGGGNLRLPERFRLGPGAGRRFLLRLGHHLLIMLVGGVNPFVPLKLQLHPPGEESAQHLGEQGVGFGGPQDVEASMPQADGQAITLDAAHGVVKGAVDRRAPPAQKGDDSGEAGHRQAVRRISGGQLHPTQRQSRRKSFFGGVNFLDFDKPAAHQGSAHEAVRAAELQTFHLRAGELRQ